MPQDQTRSARLEARIAPEALTVIRRAAEIQGRSVSDFVVAAAEAAAQRTIEETQIIRLSVEDQRAFAEAILNPPPLAPAMERAIERYRRLVAASGAEAREDAPLLDTLAAAIKRMLARGKERGYLTYDELNAALRADQMSSEQIEDTMTMLSELGINLIEAEESEDPSAAETEEGEGEPRRNVG